MRVGDRVSRLRRGALRGAGTVVEVFASDESTGDKLVRVLWDRGATSLVREHELKGEGVSRGVQGQGTVDR